MKCRKCGREIGRTCYVCLKEFSDRRKVAFEIAEGELGKLYKDNHKALTKRVKQIERQMKKDALKEKETR